MKRVSKDQKELHYSERRETEHHLTAGDGYRKTPRKQFFENNSTKYNYSNNNSSKTIRNPKSIIIDQQWVGWAAPSAKQHQKIYV